MALHDQINTNPTEERVTNKNIKIEKILILDTETTGLDENKDEVIEIGCILFDVSFKCVLSQVSFLFPVDNNEAEHVNGISADIYSPSSVIKKSTIMSFIKICNMKYFKFCFFCFYTLNFFLIYQRSVRVNLSTYKFIR